MIVGGLDVHRSQVTFDWVDGDGGEGKRGRIRPVTREMFRSWLEQLPAGHARFAVEATTGWRFIAEELQAAGFDALLGEPAETSNLRGKKRRAKTDRLDAAHLRRLAEEDRVPESWIAPAHILDLRETTRLRKLLVDHQTVWQQRIQASLYHHGVGKPAGKLARRESRRLLAAAALPDASRHAVEVALRQIAQIDEDVAVIDRWIRRYAAIQPGCRALVDNHYGIAAVLATTILAELGDVRRFPNGAAIVRYTGLDITVYSSDGKRSPGKLARQGPELLRWALFEAARCASRGGPNHDYYLAVKQRRDGRRAALSVARKLARQIRHTLIALGDDAIAPVNLPPPAITPMPA